MALWSLLWRQSTHPGQCKKRKLDYRDKTMWLTDYISFTAADTNRLLISMSVPTSATHVRSCLAANTSISNSPRRHSPYAGLSPSPWSLSTFSSSSLHCSAPTMSTASSARTCHQRSTVSTTRVSLPVLLLAALSTCTRKVCNSEMSTTKFRRKPFLLSFTCTCHPTHFVFSFFFSFTYPNSNNIIIRFFLLPFFGFPPVPCSSLFYFAAALTRKIFCTLYAYLTIDTCVFEYMQLWALSSCHLCGHSCIEFKYGHENWIIRGRSMFSLPFLYIHRNFITIEHYSCCKCHLLDSWKVASHHPFSV